VCSHLTLVFHDEPKAVVLKDSFTITQPASTHSGSGFFATHSIPRVSVQRDAVAIVDRFLNVFSKLDTIGRNLGTRISSFALDSKLRTNIFLWVSGAPFPEPWHQSRNRCLARGRREAPTRILSHVWSGPSIHRSRTLSFLESVLYIFSSFPFQQVLRVKIRRSLGPNSIVSTRIPQGTPEALCRLKGE
jgi:hypothetical protein